MLTKFCKQIFLRKNIEKEERYMIILITQPAGTTEPYNYDISFQEGCIIHHNRKCYDDDDDDDDADG